MREGTFRMFKREQIDRPLGSLVPPMLSSKGPDKLDRSVRKNALSLSVIIPTKNRPNDLANTLDTLFRQTVLPQQLIIVDQSEGSESRTRFGLMFGACSARVRETIQIVYIWDSNISGLAAARNISMKLAIGDVWLFLDDDVDLESNFIAELLKVYIDFPEVGGVSGIITNYQPPELPFRIWTRLFVRGPFHDERQPIYWNAERLRESNPIPVRKLGGGLMSYRAEEMSGIVFDENLRGVSDGEDWDFGERMSRKTSLVIAPRARLKHLQSSIGRSQDHYLWRAAKATHFLYWKNWNHGIKNRLCFAWLNLGYILLAALASIKRGSPQPFRAFVNAIRQYRREFKVDRNRQVEARICDVPSNSLESRGEPT